MLGYLRQHITDYLKANIVAYFFMILIFIIGVVAGSLAVKTLPDEQKTELLSYLHVFFQGLSTGAENMQDAKLLNNVLFNNAKTIGLIWLLGFTVIGIPFILFIIFTRGFIIGFTVGFLVNEYIMKGLVFSLVSVLPHNFFAMPALLAAGVSAISFSLLLVRQRARKTSLFYQTLSYTLFCGISLLFMLLAGFIEVVISPVFMKLLAGILMKE
ncbi:stage II sporulation protein M [Anaerospora hongkongensis]|uniref:Stage II sporulation protein M n=1 Tax=Anaerospora hongkongensis TaxID=244830 RepID=A0A4R1Q2P5_9FIRM|nr:stage II sporulation protein M [Anaerospora hongkongensis]TCL40087.1 stage II sporulation protein M [Anaerospora hongkongensis]